MALIDITTDLKSLKYGDFGAEAPLITKSVLNPPKLQGLGLEFERRKDDLVRIGKLLATGPGLKHLANQAALNVIEKNISSKFDNKTGAGRVLSGLGSTATTLASTLAQVPVNGTGTHFVEGFAGKKGYLPQIQGHVLSRNGANIDVSNILESAEDLTKTGRILGIYQKDKEQTISSQFGTGGAYPKVDPSAIVDGIQSTFNVGQSIDTVDKPKNEPLSYFQKSDALLAGKAFNRSSSGFDASSINADYSLPADAISYTRPSKSTPLSESSELTLNLDKKLQSDTFGGDLIRFFFKIITPAKSQKGEPMVKRMDFRAYLDSFSDSFTGDWNTTNFVGRADNFHTYTNFSRGISFGFKIAASSASELTRIYRKLNLLAGATAPTYVSNSFQRGTYTAVTIGDYLIDQLGFIESVDISWDPDYQWNTEINDEPGNKGKQLPTILDITVNFQPIHMEIPQSGNTFIGNPNSLFKPKFDDTMFEEGDINEVVVTANKYE